MPELPEVETTVNLLKKQIVGKKIIDLWTDTKKLVKKPSFSVFKKNLLNKKITNIQRKGKNILIFLDDSYILLIHQKLTGHLLYGAWQKNGQNWLPDKKYKDLADPYNRFIHIIFFLDNKKMLALSDLRKFAKIILDKKENILSNELSNIAPDPFDKRFTFDYLKNIFKKTKKPIKTALMDQEKISGIGNIYSDEILWKAKISPLRKADSLTEEEIKNIYQAAKDILKKAIKLQGASIIDYRKPDGSKGMVDSILKVYRKTGQKCPRCQGIIKRVIINGRSAHYCPKCQK